jgi:hypothetical protein
VAGTATRHSSRVPFEAIFGVPSTRESENESWASIIAQVLDREKRIELTTITGNRNTNPSVAFTVKISGVSLNTARSMIRGSEHLSQWRDSGLPLPFVMHRTTEIQQASIQVTT